MKQKYIPIDCNFHDILLDRATRGVIVKLIYCREERLNEKEIIIKDVYTRQGEEFLLTSEGGIIRLDQIISLDGIELFDNRYCSQ